MISDVAGILGGLVTNVSWMTLLAIVLVPGTAFVLWRTRFGLRLRSCGENPWAAESLGVNVYRYKYIGVVSSGAFGGLAGAFLSLVASNYYREGQTGGRGFIGLAAMIFGNWRPGGLLAGAGLFGFTDALQLRQAETSVHALFLALALGLAALGAWWLYRRRTVQGAVALLAAAGSLALYLFTDTVPQQFTQTTPYVTTLLVLALASQRLRMPKADGLPYRRGTASERSRGRLGRAACCRAGGQGPRLRALQRVPGGRRRARGRRPRRRRLQRGERGVRRRAVRRVRDGLRIARGRGRPARGRRRRRAHRGRRHALRTLPPAAVGERRAGDAARDGSRCVPMTEVLPDAFGPDDLERARA